MSRNTSAWSDEITLISRITTVDSDGYETYTETNRSVFCNFYDGVSINEFYSHNKDGFQQMAQADVNYFEYANEKIVEHNTTRYNVVRAFPISDDVTRIVLSEEML